MENTGRFDLPLIMPQQAQKHVTHNESITLIDGLLHLAIKSFGENSPPPNAQVDDAFVVGASPAGAWFGETGNIALNTSTGWRFTVPRQGLVAQDLSTGGMVLFDQNAWIPLGDAVEISNMPTIGINTTADATNRIAVRSNAALLTAINAGDGGNGDMQLKLNKETPSDTGSLLYQSGFSGRAEIGLAGNDDLSIKVSPDGSTWVEGLSINSTTGQVALHANSVGNTALADMPTARLKGRVTAGNGTPEDLTAAQATALLDTFSSSLKGLAPASAGGTTKFLRADGTWAAPAGGGSSNWGGIGGTLSDQADLQSSLNAKLNSVAVSAFGLTLVDDADAISARATLGLGTLATQSGTFSGNSSGTNTGDQTIILTGQVTGSGTGSFTTAISPGVVTNPMLTNIATARIKGRITPGDGSPEDLTGTQATSLLDVFTSALKGLAPASGGGTTNFLRADGAWAAPAGSGASFVPNGPNRYYAFTDCLAAVNQPEWTYVVSGTGASHSIVNFADANSIGAVRLALGTTAAGRGSISSPNFAQFQLGQGSALLASRIRLNTLSDTANTWVLRFGFLDSTAAESADAVFFRYTHSVNGGAFQAVTRSNSVETAVDTGVPASTATTYKLEVEVNASGTSAEFRINGAVVATISTNIPTGAGRETGFGLSVIRSVGTAAVNTYDCDYILADMVFDAGR